MDHKGFLFIRSIGGGTFLQWLVKYNNGAIVRQWDKGNLTNTSSVDRKNLEWFRVTEGAGKFNLSLNSNSGELKFNSLDFQKLQELGGGESLKFEFDKGSNSFRLDRESFDFLDSMLLKKEEDQFYMQFDKKGIINVCGRTFCAGAVVEGEEVPFYGKVPEFKVTVDAVNDIYMNGNTPVKAVGGITKYKIALSNYFKYKDMRFDVVYDIVYDLIKWQSYVLGKVKANKTVSSKLYTVVNGKKEVNPFVNFVAGNVYAINQFMGVA